MSLITSGTLNTLVKILASGAAGAVIYWVIKKTSIEDDQIQQILEYERRQYQLQLQQQQFQQQQSTSSSSLQSSSGGINHKRSRSLSNSTDASISLVDLLQNTLIEYILGDDTHNVITIDSLSTLDYALMRMNENNVTSLPVVDLQHKQYIGMLSIVDVCSFLGSQPTNEFAPNTSVAEVLKYNREPFVPLFVNSPIQLLIHIMTQRVSQVAIMSNETVVVDIVSRLNVIKFIYDNIEALGNKSSASLSSLSLLSKSITTINSSQKVIDALHKLNNEHITEIAVVNDDGHLIGSFSSSDLRKLSIYTFNRCLEPISMFIKVSEDPLAIDESIIINPSSTLRSTIRKFVESESPILWIVDNQNKPVSAVTQLSLLKYFLNLSTSMND
ncbi:hypothetical protein DFA_02527 [Cavenderia fasciculata]|uniref:CBS domain-containing protein n=1 Tax=Cavenderia fasciculata TaxID=261658 RepID=F4PZM4_CACFS|nr:uncharacterized protein DFA_02527 [Cavenderia fasciculata]EGG18788.1 hypothetical protein DFA_02527 [Cavenderia fasciculata]|eukprot:XP_004357250.1 hypothetical protein DFA_02527 [Cavenderia fasciculata]